MTDQAWDFDTAAHRRLHTEEAVRSANNLLDRARRAEWSANFRAMFARLASLAPLMWQHNKRGTLYALVGVATVRSSVPIAEGDTVTIYIGRDGELHARRTEEYDDGRFTFVPGPGQPKHPQPKSDDFAEDRARRVRGRTE